jgi:hypothetical protein
MATPIDFAIIERSSLLTFEGKNFAERIMDNDRNHNPRMVEYDGNIYAVCGPIEEVDGKYAYWDRALLNKCTGCDYVKLADAPWIYHALFVEDEITFEDIERAEQILSEL